MLGVSLAKLNFKDQAFRLREDAILDIQQQFWLSKDSI